MRARRDRRFRREKCGVFGPTSNSRIRENLAMFQRIVKLAGVTFRDAQKNIRTFGCEDIGSYALVREPDNPHDPNAIRVALGGTLFLRYVPKEIAKELAPLMDAGREFLALFVRRNESPYHGAVGLMVQIVEVTGEKKVSICQ
jgi:HIRAN domain